MVQGIIAIIPRIIAIVRRMFVNVQRMFASVQEMYSPATLNIPNGNGLPHIGPAQGAVLYRQRPCRPVLGDLYRRHNAIADREW